MWGVDWDGGGRGGEGRRTRGAAPGLTFWATWVTHGEVQLLRSGPRGFHVTCSAKHWKEAMPGDEQREQKRGRGCNGKIIISIRCGQLKKKEMNKKKNLESKCWWEEKMGQNGRG